MVRSVTVVLILTAVASVCAVPVQRVARDLPISTDSQVNKFFRIPQSVSGNFGADSFSYGHGGDARGGGDGGHGGNFGNTHRGNSGDTGRITHG